MKPDFLISYNKALAPEGTLSNNPSDKGGLTYKGISRVKHSSWPGWIIIDELLASSSCKSNHDILEDSSLLQNLVTIFYHEEFWITIRGDQLPSQTIADELFESSINLGVQAAAENLQRAINLLNRNNRLYPDIAVDGILGSQTLATLNKCISVNGEKLIYNLLNFYQAKHYIEIMERDHTQEIFIGWFNRIELIK